MAHSINHKAKVAIIKGDTPREVIMSGINHLGGMSNYISKGDNVFIIFNLRLPNGFPTNANFDVIGVLIKSCLEAGANSVKLGSFPFQGVSIKAISDLLGLRKYIKHLGGELVFLDNSIYFNSKEIDDEQLKRIKNDSFKRVEIHDREILIPKTILDSDKIISLNQVSVDPLFKVNSCVLNSYSIIPQYMRNACKDVQNKEADNLPDIYMQELISNILDVYALKKPVLAINDLFYFLEGAGPFIYKDSKLRKSNLIIIGEDAVAVDLVLLKLFDLDLVKNELMKEAESRGIKTADLSNVTLIGEKLKNLTIDIDLCDSNLTQIGIKNFSIKKGEICSGCIKQAYHLLNLIMTNMVKDLKYLSKNSFLIGKNPPNPEYMDLSSENVIGNIILFGDCTLESTTKSRFRQTIIKKVKIPNVRKIELSIRSLENKKSELDKEDTKKILKINKVINKKSDKLEKLRIKVDNPKITISVKENKNILELSGCPPDLFDCVESIIKYYGKKDVPTLNLFYYTIKSYLHRKMKKNLEKWEAF